MSIDYRTLLADELMRNWPSTIWNRDAARITVDNLLATRIPDPCPDCKGNPCPKCDGTGEVAEQHEPWATEMLGCGYCHGEPCPHLNAPTIADLLRWGEWVATAERTFNDNWNLWGWVVNGEWVDDADLLAALRTEAEQSGADR